MPKKGERINDKEDEKRILRKRKEGVRNEQEGRGE